MFSSGFLFISTHISLDLISLRSAEAYTGWGGKLNGHLMASCVGNICTKNYQNLINGFQVTVKNVGDFFFETQCTSLWAAMQKKPVLLLMLWPLAICPQRRFVIHVHVPLCCHLGNRFTTSSNSEGETCAVHTTLEYYSSGSSLCTNGSRYLTVRINLFS